MSIFKVRKIKDVHTFLLPGSRVLDSQLLLAYLHILENHPRGEITDWRTGKQATRKSQIKQ